MGYSMLMQWTPASTPAQTSISDILLSRVLEHYNITHPLRSTIQFRTFRATLPPAGTLSDPSNPTPTTPAAIRLLTTITYSQSMMPVRDATVPHGARDDVTYLFIEDRTVAAAAGTAGDSTAAAGTGAGSASGSAAPVITDLTKGSRSDGKDKKDAGLEEDGFEIVDSKGKDEGANAANGNTNSTSNTNTNANVNANNTSNPNSSQPRRLDRSYKILAVKPATQVLPLLTNLLSPFVLGLSKSARAAASTTGQTQAGATPTSLSGTPLVLTTLAFPPTAPPYPALSLSVHILPSVGAGTIFLEVEAEAGSSSGSGSIGTGYGEAGFGSGPGSGDQGLFGDRGRGGPRDSLSGPSPASGSGVPPSGPGSALDQTLRQFLLGCVPDGIAGETKFMTWPTSERDDGWTGIERTRRVSMLLARALREGAFI